MDAFFDDEPGYRIRARRVRAARRSASRPTRPRWSAWPPGSGSTPGWPRRPPTPSASSPPPASTLDLAALDIAEPRLSADEPAFDVFWEATQARHAGRRSTTAARRRPQPLTRHLQPWGVVRYSGRWYVVGLDTDRGEERVFRLSRVVGRGHGDRQPRRRTRSRPAPTCARSPAGWRPRRAAERGRACWSARAPGRRLRRGAASVEADVAGPDDATPLGPAACSPRRRGLADELLALRRRRVRRGAGRRCATSVVARLRAAAGAA